MTTFGVNLTNLRSSYLSHVISAAAYYWQQLHRSDGRNTLMFEHFPDLWH